MQLVVDRTHDIGAADLPAAVLERHGKQSAIGRRDQLKKRPARIGKGGAALAIDGAAGEDEIERAPEVGCRHLVEVDLRRQH